MGTLSLAAVQMAVDGLMTRHPTAAQNVYEHEQRVDDEEVEIERQAINLLALHQPAASDLRTIFAIVKINGDLERIADCAVNIAQQVGPLAQSDVEVPMDLRHMGESVLRQLGDTLDALSNRDIELAERVARNDNMIDALYNELLRDLQAAMIADSKTVPGNLALLLMAKNLERIGDHCTNIAEDVVYRMRGRIVRHSHDPR